MILRTALTILVIASGVANFSPPAADHDLWGHVAFGREILVNGLPERNHYSYTAPDHPWINHEILAECAFAWAFNAFGSPGLLGLKLAMGFLTLAAMALATRQRAAEPLAWAAALVLATSLMPWGYLVRPQLFTFLGLAVLWTILHRWHEGPTRSIWAIPLLFVFWINSHGGVLAGFGILVVVAAIRFVSPGEHRDRRTFPAVVALGALALLVNPYGFELVHFLVEDVQRTRPITEWAPVSPFDLSYPGLKLVALLIIAGSVIRRGRPSWETAVVVLAVFAAFRHERHVPLLAVLAAPHLSVTLASFVEWLGRFTGPRPLSGAARKTLAAGIFGIAVLEVLPTWRTYRAFDFGIFVSPEEFPVHAIRFIRRNRLAGNLALPFDWGEYAIWHLHPDSRVSIDGRYTTAYPDDVIEASWHYMSGEQGWDRLLDKADLALAARRQGTARRLFADERWTYVYSDPTAILFVRADLLPRSFDRRPNDPEGAFTFP